MSMGLLSACISVHFLYARCQLRPNKGIRCPGARVTAVSHQSEFSEKQSVFLHSGPSFQPNHYIFIRMFILFTFNVIISIFGKVFKCIKHSFRCTEERKKSPHFLLVGFEQEQVLLSTLYFSPVSKVFSLCFGTCL